MAETKPQRWKARKIGDNEYVVEDGIHSQAFRNEHCKCCALMTAILRYGGRADLRGLHIYGICYQTLAVTSRASEDKDEDGENA